MKSWGSLEADLRDVSADYAERSQGEGLAEARELAVRGRSGLRRLFVP